MEKRTQFTSAKWYLCICILLSWNTNVFAHVTGVSNPHHTPTFVKKVKKRWVSKHTHQQSSVQDELQKLLKVSPAKRKQIIKHLVLRGSTVAPQLALALRSTSSVIRTEACKILRRMKAKAHTAVPVLEQNLKLSKFLVRLLSLRVLRSIGPKAKPALSKVIPLMKDKKHIVQEEAARFVAQHTNKKDPLHKKAAALAAIRKQNRTKTIGIRGLLNKGMGGGPGGNIFGKSDNKLLLKKLIGTSGKGSSFGLGMRGRGFGSGGGGLGSKGYGVGGGGGFGSGKLGAGGYGRYGSYRRRKKIRVKVKLIAVTVSGPTNIKKVRIVVRRKLYQVRYCYLRSLYNNSKLKGNVQLQWVIRPFGRAYKVSILKSTAKNKRFHRCLIGRVLRWRFPKGKKKSKVMAFWSFAKVPKPKIAKIRPPKPIVRGFLRRAQIARVVRRNWFQIKYCYEKELRKNPKLNGTILVSWYIQKTGYTNKVKIAKTTMKNKRVENCIVRRITRWKFPKPKGGIVMVKYPFKFKTI